MQHDRTTYEFNDLFPSHVVATSLDEEGHLFQWVHNFSIENRIFIKKVTTCVLFA